jgi:hypothetical protein
MLSLAGCKTPTATDEEPAVAQKEPEGATSPEMIKVAPKPQPQATASTDPAGTVPATVSVQENNPGSGPPPREYVRSKVEAIEGSLSPLDAVPTGSAAN